MDLTLQYFLLLSTGFCFATNDSQDVKITVLKEHSCSLGDIDIANPTSCEGVEDGGLTVRHQGYCLVNINGTETFNSVSRTILTCDHGHWSGTDSSVGKNGRLLQRRKRYFFEILAALFIVCFLFCEGGGWGGGTGGGGGGDGGSDTGVHTKYPPSFNEPCMPGDVQYNYNVSAGDSGAVISWTEPVATDRDDGVPSVNQVDGGANGGKFKGATYGKTHYITYKATDSDGLTAHCHFSFTVTLLTCNVLPWPDHGARTCENSNILGGSCNYTCDPGYQLSGSNTVTCENHMSPTWSQIPTCEEIKCSSPSYPANSTIRCSDMTYPYQSICTIHCDTGLSLDGPGYMQCQADGTWSNVGLSKCDSSPTLTCITPQIFYADRALTTTSVTWTEPTALDNTDPHPTIVKTDGPSMGAVLEVGSEIVQYKAIDSEGNESPKCFIELRVEEITCGHPMDSFNDTFLVFNCTKPRYTYGTSCTLSCLAHLPLEGANMTTCEDNGKSKGIWDWKNGGRPYCKEMSCPELDPPVNGALVLDSIRMVPVYTMTCNNQYDIPNLGSNFNGMFFCKDQGGWTPFESVPDCTETKSPRFVNLPAEIFYYSGDCGTNETMAQIKRHFQVILVNYLKPYFESICPTGETCSAENIEIHCGRIQSRTKRSLSLEYNAEDFRKLKHYLREKSSRRGHSVQKRQTETHLFVLKFNIVVALDVNSNLRQAIGRYDHIQLNILKPAVQEMVNNGTFDLDGFVLKNDSFQTADFGEVKCDPGYELDDTKCKQCPVGYSWNNTKCEQCPIGQYKDIESEISCSNCPVGFSTKKTRSKSQNDCIKLCSPGSYSPDTLESCSPCLRGFYQDEYGQTLCKVCPAGTTTESINSSSITDCRIYDVLLKNTNGEVNVSTLLATMNSLTFMFWSKQFNDRPSDVVFSLRSDGADILNVHLSETVRVEIPSQMNETVGLHSSTSWKHVTVTWDTINSRITVYIGGESVYIKEAVIAPNVPLIDNGALIVKGSGPTGVFLSGLHLLAKVLPDSDVANHSTSCYVIENEDVVNIDAFDGFEKQGITIITSSQCDAIDECSPSPCNGHLCTNRNDNFTCTCLGGWSGTTCTIPPRVCKKSMPVTYGIVKLDCFMTCPPVDGGWSEWTSWTECSQSCGSGTQSRTRNCDSPTPDTYGKECVGNSTEKSSCNVNDCPVCAELHRQFGSLLNCSIEPMSAMVTCVLYCEKGRFLPPGLRDFQTYTCGPGTNYDWDPLDSLPNCVEPLGPRNASIGVSLNYTSVISDSSKQTVVDAVSHNLEATPCHNDSNCQTEVEITKSNDISVSIVYVTFSIPLLLGPELQYDAYISDGILSDALQELQSAILNLESTAKYIQNYTSEIYDVTSNDVSVFADSSSLTFEAMLRCDSGYAVQDGFCLRCPSGTHSDNGVCSFCGKGTYQESTGQTSCSRCPSGLTTSTIGSSNISQCTEEKVKVATSSPTSESTTSTLEQSEDKETLFITIAIAGSGLMFAVAAICVVAWCKIRRSNSKQIGVVIDMKIECKSGCTMVYKKARPADTLPMTPSPVKPDLISMTDCDMLGSEAAVTPDMRPHVAKMPPTDRPHVTVTGDINEPHFYDLPECIENDDHTYSNIYEQ